ncbi:MAG: two component sigma54 specific Fis family transcriptional regulator [Ignavibacteria bacterium]|nr:MAG: two component sigma54 specific Fis family transcriptional regulator [Ignavibacteria bacterium]KAF0161430.1 MAG: two component sigma54 specific Fis family transcriptional regulator [Ignavibacteria bacterium]
MKKHCNLLVIDDEQVIIDSICKIASLENLSVESALLGSDAFEKISQTDFDLIICDIMLPELDGFQILNELYRRNIESPVIMTTGYSTIENAVKSLYLGAIDFIPKPFTIDEMIALINRGMRYSKLLEAKRNEASNVLLVPCPARYFRLGYSCWMNIQLDGSVIIGATDFFIKTVEPIKQVELINCGETLRQASACAKFINCDEHSHPLYSVLSGNIKERNEKVIKLPELIEKDPYFNGWLYRIIPTELECETKLLIPCSSDRA